MCGIIGYFGKEQAQDILLSGLKALEYRGYDSSGMAVVDAQKVTRIRAEGNISCLEEKLLSQKVSGTWGVAHTRWATHGLVAENNAHPHQVGNLVLVHNGVIENYQELKNDLESCSFTSETDSEVVLHLIYQEFLKSKDLKTASLKALKKIKGSYAFLVICEDQEGEIFAVKQGPPLVVSQKNEEFYFVSDTLAFPNSVKEGYYLEDGEAVHLRGGKLSFFDLHAKPINKKKNPVVGNLGFATKSSFDHFMLKEIFEQPVAFNKLLKAYVKDNKVDLGLDIDFSNFDRVVIVACGSSYYAGLLGRWMIEKYARVSVVVEIASEFRYKSPLLTSKDLVILVSQSGETADTLGALNQMLDKKVQVISFCNVTYSSLARKAHYNLDILAGPEIGVASTKSYTNSVALFYLLAFQMAFDLKQMTGKELSVEIQKFKKVPSYMEQILEKDQDVYALSGELKSYKTFLFLGRGFCYPLALEGALKLKELSYIHAEAFPAGELKHGPLALVDENVVALGLIPQDDMFQKTRLALEEVSSRGGSVVNFSDKNTTLKNFKSITVPSCEESGELFAFSVVVVLQLLSYSLALNLGHNVDQPRNLAKSVTVE